MADAESLVAACREITEPLDGLICNAAVFGNHAYHLHEFEPVDFANTFAVNCIAPALMARELRGRLLEGAGRKLIMMSTGNASLAGNVSGEMMAYRASKSALNQMVRNYAAEWGPQGLVTVALNPGNDGGTVTFLAAPSGSELFIESNPFFDQQIGFTNATF